MKKATALQLLLEWQKKHEREDLFGVGDIPTDIGRRAIEDLVRFDKSDVRKAMADTELGDDFPKMYGVFKRLRNPAPRAPKPIECQMPVRIPYEHHQVIHNKKHDWYGWVQKADRFDSAWWVVKHPVRDKYIGVACQCFNAEDLGKIEAVDEETAAAVKETWQKLRDEKRLDPAGLPELVAECLAGSMIGKPPANEQDLF